MPGVSNREKIEVAGLHEFLLWASKSLGLFYLLGFSAVVLAYVYWPSNRRRFDRAAEMILDQEDKPWR